MATPALTLNDLIRQSQQKQAAVQAEAEKAMAEHLAQQALAPQPDEDGTVENVPEDENSRDNQNLQQSGEIVSQEASTVGGDSGNSEQKKKRRFEQVDEATLLRRTKSKWAGEHTKILFPAVLSFLPAGLCEEQMEAMLLRVRIEDVNKRHVNPVYGIDPNEPRSPSPEPTYDNFGRRTNTRDIRVRNAINNERTALIDRAQKLNPNFRPPNDFKQERKKLEAKLRFVIFQATCFRESDFLCVVCCVCA
jgi:hypothetical protein